MQAQSHGLILLVHQTLQVPQLLAQNVLFLNGPWVEDFKSISDV